MFKKLSDIACFYNTFCNYAKLPGILSVNTFPSELERTFRNIKYCMLFMLCFLPISASTLCMFSRRKQAFPKFSHYTIDRYPLDQGCQNYN